MFKKKISILLLALCAASFSFAQEIKLKFKIDGTQDSTVFLYRHWGDQKYFAADTALSDANGSFTFSKGNYEGGMYGIIVGGMKILDVIVNNENIDMETTFKNPYDNMKIKKSKENQLFFDYHNVLNEKGAKRNELLKVIKDSTQEESKIDAAKTELSALGNSVQQFQKDFVKDNKGTLTAKIVNMLREVEIPDTMYNDKHEFKNRWAAYDWNRLHYFDNIDLKDDRLLNTHFFHSRLDRFYKEMVQQHPDSIIMLADSLISKTKEGTELFKYIVHDVTYRYGNIMCMDGVFSHMILKYYDTEKAFWMTDKEKLKEKVDAAKNMQNVLCGKTAKNLSLADTSGKWTQLYGINKEYTVLIFWDPDCGHCKKEMPRYAEIYEKYKDQGKLEIYAVGKDEVKYNKDSVITERKWNNFINENKLNFINVAVPHEIIENNELATPLVIRGLTTTESLNYQITYDVYSTPKVFLLDKDKKIIAKRIGAEQLEDHLRTLWDMEPIKRKKKEESESEKN